LGEYLKSGRECLRILFVLIIGLAFTNSLDNLFDNSDLKQFEFNVIFNFLVFLSFISRFFIGGYRSLTFNIENNVKFHKLIADGGLLFFTSIFLYMMSAYYLDDKELHICLGLLLLSDTVWLSVLYIFRYWRTEYRQWFIHNIIMFVVIGVNYLFINYSIYTLLIASMIAAISDFYFNKEFYFPSLELKDGNLLRRDDDKKDT
jgi:hypothetical protein